MQKPSFEEHIHYKKLELPYDFPISFISHTQYASKKTRMHFHNGLEIGYCLEGSGVFYIENRIVQFKPRDVSIIFQNQPHIARSSDQTESFWYFLTVDPERLLSNWNIANTPAYRRFMSDEIKQNNIIDGYLHKDISDLVLLMYDQLFNPIKWYQDNVRSLMLSLFLKLGSLPSESQAETYEYVYDTTILEAVNYITRNYSEPISVAEWAEMFRLSESQFRRNFLNTMGCLPHDYQNNVRLNMACSLLMATNESLSNIAYEVGFQSISSFNRQFSKRFGMAPKDYRTQKRYIGK